MLPRLVLASSVGPGESVPLLDGKTKQLYHLLPNKRYSAIVQVPPTISSFGVFLLENPPTRCLMDRHLASGEETLCFCLCDPAPSLLLCPSQVIVHLLVE
jgi:hypothetical protein